MEILLGFIATVLLATSITSFIIIRNLLIQNSQYESWVTNLSNRVESTYLKMKEVDERGMFESDDDVGFAFRELKELMDDLSEKLGTDDDEATNIHSINNSIE